MKWRWLRKDRAFALVVVAIALYGIRLSTAAQRSRGGLTTFDSDPNHIWNRTYACLFIRQSADGKAYGADALDPLLWPATQHLLTDDSHRRALTCLDEFLLSHAERAVRDPVRRAILQRDLWAVFDWAAAGEDLPQQRRELETRLAEGIRRLALTPDQVHALPNTYADAAAGQRFAAGYDPRTPQQPFLPPALFRSDGPWVCLSSHSEGPTAIVHFSGRSRFLVFMRLPEGRDATRAYVRKLRSSSEPPLLSNRSGATVLNLGLPQFPVGTEVALVRQAIVIDTEGKLLPTALTESVQLRVYHAVTSGTRYMNYINGPSSHDQDFFEFRMSRPELFAGHNGGLFAVGPSQTEFTTFSTHGMDWDGQGVILERCRSCHVDSGIHSVQSRTQWMKAPPDIGGQVSREAGDNPIAWETNVTITRKEQQPEFKMLQRLWQAPRD
jgi:hypothetical protein